MRASDWNNDKASLQLTDDYDTKDSWAVAHNLKPEFSLSWFKNLISRTNNLSC